MWFMWLALVRRGGTIVVTVGRIASPISGIEANFPVGAVLSPRSIAAAGKAAISSRLVSQADSSCGLSATAALRGLRTAPTVGGAAESLQGQPDGGQEGADEEDVGWAALAQESAAYEAADEGSQELGAGEYA